MHALLVVHVARRAVAVGRKTVATNFGPPRRTARRFDGTNRGNTRATAILKWRRERTNVMGATCTGTTCSVSNERAAIVPRIGATTRPRSATKRANSRGTTRTAARRHRYAGLANAVGAAPIVDRPVAIVIDVVATYFIDGKYLLCALQ